MEFSFVNFTLVDIGMISVALLALLAGLRRRKSERAEHEALKVAHEALRADHEALKAAYTAQTEEFEAYRQAADLRYRELQSTSDRRYNVLQEENAAIQEENAVIREENAALQEKNAALQKEVGEQRREIATQAGILEELKIGFHQLRGRYDEIKDLLTKLVDKL